MWPHDRNPALREAEYYSQHGVNRKESVRESKTNGAVEYPDFPGAIETNHSYPIWIPLQEKESGWSLPSDEFVFKMREH
jgi:hypothetical protein